MRILNLYAGIGGNRKLWGDSHQITAVEYKPEIAAIYHDFFPNDKIVVADAHEYLQKNYENFDFIWSSPPCPTHSRINETWRPTTIGEVNSRNNRRNYPDMRLYQEIIFLKHFFLGKWCIENVIAYYEPLIRPMEFGGHWFWTNFALAPFNTEKNRGLGKKSNRTSEVERRSERMGIILPSGTKNARLLIRNCTEPELGKHILDWSQKEWHHTANLFSLATPPSEGEGN